MKYIVILPECYQENRPARLANPEFKDHKEAVRKAIAISKATGRGYRDSALPEAIHKNRNGSEYALI